MLSDEIWQEFSTKAQHSAISDITSLKGERGNWFLVEAFRKFLFSRASKMGSHLFNISGSNYKLFQDSTLIMTWCDRRSCHTMSKTQSEFRFLLFLVLLSVLVLFWILVFTKTYLLFSDWIFNVFIVFLKTPGGGSRPTNKNTFFLRFRIFDHYI